MSRSRHLVFSERFVPTRVVPTARFADAKNPLPHSFNDTQSRFHPVRPLQARGTGTDGDRAVAIPEEIIPGRSSAIPR